MLYTYIYVYMYNIHIYLYIIKLPPLIFFSLKYVYFIQYKSYDLMEESASEITIATRKAIWVKELVRAF